MPQLSLSQFEMCCTAASVLALREDSLAAIADAFDTLAFDEMLMLWWIASTILCRSARISLGALAARSLRVALTADADAARLGAPWPRVLRLVWLFFKYEQNALVLSPPLAPLPPPLLQAAAITPPTMIA